MKDKPKRLAVIDLGTNTFHLLIVDAPPEKGWKEIFRERQYVYLASAGIEKISEQAYERGIHTINYFKTIINEYQVDEYKAIGTAALRSAANSKDFIAQVIKETGISIDVIDGDQEASYISAGVELALDGEIDDFLIMDIGGGSVEFILHLDRGIAWQQSFPIGLAVLKAQDIFVDPLSEKAQSEYEQFIFQKIESLIQLPQLRKGLPLVGASGTFDALLQLIPSEEIGMNCKKVKIAELDRIYKDILPLDYNQRLEHPDIPNERAELFALALFLVRLVEEHLEADNIYISPYALKEGVLQSMK
jgi:exopolyphosphatase/guanosine-5'-triphosphate,3'-diphosphate pyrophosphatase